MIPWRFNEIPTHLSIGYEFSFNLIEGLSTEQRFNQIS